MVKRKTTEEFIQQAIAVHGDKYDYSKVEYINAKTKVKIACFTHGIFKQTPDNHLNGQKCPHCAGIGKKTTEEFIRQARIIHGGKFDYSNVVYVRKSTKVKIVCQNHGVFEQTPHGHLKGRGCLKCRNENTSLRQTQNKEDFIFKARKAHGDKYDYSQSKYAGSNIKTEIICPWHGLFVQTPHSHISGVGCPKCANNIRKTTDEFIQQALIVHGERYDYSDVKYQDSKSKVNIKCPDHGLFKLAPDSHLSKRRGCPGCAEHGFDFNKPAIIYLLQFQTDIASFWKIGITNRTICKRFLFNERRWIKAGYQWQCEGIKAYGLEQEILKAYRHHRISYLFPLLTSGGDTECFNLNLPHRKIIKEITAKLGTQPEIVHVGLSDSLESLIG